MKALVQRVLQAEVRVEGASVGAIGPGVLLFLGIEQGDAARQIPRLVERVLGLRVFPSEGRPLDKPLDRSLSDVGGGLLVVSQFTLAADSGAAAVQAFPPRRRLRWPNPSTKPF